MSLYPFAFLIAVLSLSWWFFQTDSNKKAGFIPIAFYGAFLLWAVSLIFSELTLQEKLPVFIRDLLLMGGIPMALRIFSKNKPLFFLSLAFLVGIYYGFGYDIWEQSLRATTASEQEIKEFSEIPDYELLVELKDKSDIQSFKKIAERNKLSFKTAFHPAPGVQTDLDNYLIVDIPNKRLGEKETVLKDLRESGLVDWIENNEKINLDEPTTQLRPISNVNEKWEVNDPDLNKQWALKTLEADKLYKLLRSKKIKTEKKARVFILDTGIDAKHEDLAAVYRSVQEKYDTDRQGHGTHCAGIAGAITNNNKGIASLQPENAFIEISSVKVLSDFGSGTQQGIIKGIIEAADAGADVISMSLGGRSTDGKQRAYRQAVKYANDAGAVVIVAAGNSNANAKNYAPAGAPGVICVSAIDTSLNRASFSNYVQEVKWALAAPGTQIHSTFPGNNYKAFNGTSMATPFVAGLVGILKSIDPDLSTEEVYQILSKTGKNTESTKETGKLIAPYAAIKAVLEK